MKEYGKEVFRLIQRRGPTEFSEWIEKQISIRDTGVVMERRSCKFHPSKNHPEGFHETWPWKVVRRLPRQEVVRYCQQLVEEGWELKYGKRKLKDIG